MKRLSFNTLLHTQSYLIMGKNLLMIQWHNCVMPLILNTTSSVHTCLNQMEKQRILINSSKHQSENYARMINKIGSSIKSDPYGI